MIPHGPMLSTQSGFDVSSGSRTLSGVNVESVGGYRSVVVQVKNNGSRDLVFTPEWDFYSGASHIRSTDSQRVTAGTSKRLLFQNQADLLNKITVTGGGAGDTIDYAVVPSNLDPLPRSAPDYLILYGISQNVTAPPIGDNDHAKFDAATFRTNDASLWSFVLDAGGRVKEVDTSAPGRYESFVQGKFAPPGAANQITLVLNVFGVGPIAMSPDVSTTSAVQEEVFVGAFTEMQQGTAQWTVQPVISVAGPLAFIAPYWWIKRWAI